MKYRYYYGTEADQFSFIRIPKILLTGPDFRELSIQAKLLYGLLLDRMSLSVKNHWLDDDNKVYIIYQISDIQDDLGYSKKKSIDCLDELEQIGLIEKKKRGFGLPNIIYVKNFMLSENGTSRSVDFDTSVEKKADSEVNDSSGISDENSLQTVENGLKNTGITEIFEEKGQRSVENGTSRGAKIVTSRSVEICTSRGAENDTSGGAEIDTSEVPKSTPLMSNTKYNNTDYSNILSNLILSNDCISDADEKRSDKMDSYTCCNALIRKNLEADIMLERYPNEQEQINGIIELITEVIMSSGETILVAGDKYPAEVVKRRLLSLNSMHLEYVLECLSANTTKVRNVKKYLLTTLFNAPVTMQSYYQVEINHDMPWLAQKQET